MALEGRSDNRYHDQQLDQREGTAANGQRPLSRINTHIRAQKL
jgi:hypothetical protein